MRTVVVLSALLLATLPATAGEEPITLPAPPGELHGTFLSSTANAPAILILAGSGPTDRNGNSPLGVHSDMYKLLAEGLAAKGISSLRYDKRGIAQSKDAMTAEADLRIQTYANDASAMGSALRKRTGLKCIWVLGHSEGALLAEMMAQQPSGLCGLILTSGAGMKAADMLRQQLAASLPPAMQPAAFAALTELEAGRTVPNPPQPAALFHAGVQPYLISWFGQDPPSLLASVHLPVMILQGDTDLQVSPADAARLALAKPDAELVMLPGVNHILKMAPMDRAANMATYANPALLLAPGVVDRIATFVHEHSK